MSGLGMVEPCFLAGFDLGGGDFDQLGGAGFADQKRDFVVGGRAALDREELGNGLVALLAALAVLEQEVLGDATDLKTGVAPFGIAPGFDVIAQAAYLVSEVIAINLGEVGATLVDGVSLERLPAVFGGVPGEIGGDGMGVELGIELAAGVVVIDGDNEIAVVRSWLAPARRTPVAA